MRTLYLHIGIDKTGTTFLQDCFAASRLVFREHGYLYPVDGDDARDVERSKMVPCGNGNTLLSTKDSLVQSLDRAQAAEGPDWDKVFYSSEVLFEYLADKADPVAALQPAFGRQIGRIEILVFLRDPLVHAASRWQQSVKGWQGETASLEQFVAEKYDHPQKLASLLTRLAAEETIGLTVKNYDVHKADLVSVVEQWLSLPSGTLKQSQERKEGRAVNRALGWSEGELQRRLNRELGQAAGKLFAFRLANETAGVKEDAAIPAPEAQHSLWERIDADMATLNALMPEGEGFSRQVREAAPKAALTFTPEQADVIAQGIAQHIRELQQRDSLKAQLRRKLGRR